jgi:hypothetical protein
MSKLTPVEVVKLIKGIVSYGDDPFEEAYSEINRKYQECTDEEEKKFYDELIKLLDVLYHRMFR